MTRQGRRLLCLGDSNTYGYDPASFFGEAYPPSVRWTGRLEAAGWRVLNRGMNGMCVPAPGQYRAFLDLIEAARPMDALSLMFGSNDLLMGRSAAETGERMARFLDALAPLRGETALILLAPPPLRFGDWVTEDAVIRASEALAGEYGRIAAARGLRCADAGRWGVDLACDGVHFTPEGHAAFSRGLLAALREALPDEL